MAFVFSSSPGVLDLPSSSPLSQPEETPTVEGTPATDIVAQPFSAFNHVGVIVQPFDVEAKRDDDFQQELNNMLLELMLDFHAWSSARPLKQSEQTADALEKGINGLVELENEQGMSSSTSGLLSPLIEKTRQRLNDFVVRIKLALAALTGLGSG